MDGGLAETALAASLVRLADLDPACPAHLQGILSALGHGRLDGVEIPTLWLRRFPLYNLWTHCHHPSLTAFLAEQIEAQPWTAPLWADIPVNPHTGLPNNLSEISRAARQTFPGGARRGLPVAIQAALRHKLFEHPYPEPLQEALTNHWIPDTEPIQALLQVARTHEAAAKEAARTQSRRRAAALRRQQDPLLLAIQSGRPYLVNRFKLTALSPDRLAALLPAWQAAPADVHACLLQVPNLDPETHIAALTAWSSLPEATRPGLSYPVPLRVLEMLPAEPRADVLALDLHLRTDHVIDPPLTDATLQNVLFPLALHDPTLTKKIETGYQLRVWHATLRALATRTVAEQPTAPELTWVQLFTKLASFNQEALLTTRAALVYTLFQTWPSDWQVSLAGTLAAWLDKTPYLCLGKK